MVKRQTVWLSTMMVLSLMLIGYYTVNNGAGTSSTTGGTDTVTTAGSGTDNSSQASGTDSNSSSSNSQTQSHTTNTSNDDWFYQSRTKLEQNMARNSQMYQQIIASDKSSNAQVVQAQQEAKQLTALEGSLSNARDAVLAEGYTDCVIFPTIDSKTGSVQNLQVYVKTSNLSSDKAIQIMNVVSQNMGIDFNRIVVHEHA